MSDKEEFEKNAEQLRVLINWAETFMAKQFGMVDNWKKANPDMLTGFRKGFDIEDGWFADGVEADSRGVRVRFCLPHGGHEYFDLCYDHAAKAIARHTNRHVKRMQEERQRQESEAQAQKIKEANEKRLYLELHKKYGAGLLQQY